MRVDVGDSQCNEWLDSVVVAAVLEKGHEALWPNLKGAPTAWKKSPSWVDVRKNRVAISTLLDLTSGHTLKHKVFLGQVVSWLRRHQISWCLGDIEAAVYRLRVQMGQLRDLARTLKRPPREYANLQSLLDKFDVTVKVANIFFNFCCNFFKKILNLARELSDLTGLRGG